MNKIEKVANKVCWIIIAAAFVFIVTMLALKLFGVQL